MRKQFHPKVFTCIVVTALIFVSTSQAFGTAHRHEISCTSFLNQRQTRHRTLLSLSEERYVSKRDMVSSLLDHETISIDDWREILPYEDSSHNSATIIVPCDSSKNSIFEKNKFGSKLESTVEALREMGKSSVWVEIPMQRASLIEEMEGKGFELHHAQGKIIKLNMWLRDDVDSKVPEYATHHVGVGAVVVNSREEILCVKGLRKNFMPWKIPGGLADIGENIPEAAEREVMEETGIQTKFHSILTFRHSHGLANGRSDLFFVCRLDPVEEVGEDGKVIIKNPTPQECEIAEARWVPLSEYRDMVNGKDGKPGHPMMSEVLQILDRGLQISHRQVQSIVPGRHASPIYHPDAANPN